MGEIFGGRYELIDLIGEGGMGAVWRAWDQRMRRIGAAKVLRQSRCCGSSGSRPCEWTTPT